MLDDDDAIVERFKLAQGGWLGEGDLWNRQIPNPPASLTDLRRAETLLGFPLPTLLRRIYLEVGNGGVGPGYGLLPLFTREGEDPHQYLSLVDTTLCYYKDGWYSPKTFLVICDWGCNILSRLDCSRPEYPVERDGWSGGSGPYDNEQYKPEAPSLRQWLQGWLDGQTLFNIYEKPVSPLSEVLPHHVVMTPEVKQRLRELEQHLRKAGHLDDV